MLARSYSDYLCPDWEGEEHLLYLMNSNEASFNGGLVSNQIILQIFICDNNTKEIDSHSIWDDNEKWRDEGWNHRRDNDP